MANESVRKFTRKNCNKKLSEINFTPDSDSDYMDLIDEIACDLYDMNILKFLKILSVSTFFLLLIIFNYF